ncbi:MAG: hypothetical protein OHK0039_00180 [Bacteroidia bacterium]
MSSYRASLLEQHLLDKVLRYTRNASDSDYSGGGWFEEVNYALYLHRDKSFYYRIETFRNIRGGGFSLPQEHLRELGGRWEVRWEAPAIKLVLYVNDGRVLSWATEDAGNGLQRMDEMLWNRYRQH